MVGSGSQRHRTGFGEKGAGIGLGVLKTGWKMLEATGRETFL